MAVKQKPQEDVLKLAERALSHPEQLTGSEIKRMATHLLEAGKAAPDQEGTSFTAQVIAKVGGLLPDSLKAKSPKDGEKVAPPSPPKPAAKPKPAPKPKAAPKAKPPPKG